MKKFFPILEWLPNYPKKYLRGDIFSGITVGVLLIPQGMAYAMIAGLPPIYGLYAALMPQVIYAIMGTSRQLSVGPVAMDSLLVASGLGALQLSGVDSYISMAIMLAFMVGVVQVILGFLKFGFLVNFLSKPVISGFTSGAAIIIGLNQVSHLFGTDISKSSRIHDLAINIYNAIGGIHIPTLIIGVLGIGIIILLKKLNNQIPAALILVVLGIVTFNFSGIKNYGIGILENIPSGLPKPINPLTNYSEVLSLVSIAITIALVGFMEAISLAKTIECNHKYYKVKANKELIALGFSNIVGSIFQSYPTTGGLSRTAVNNSTGAKTGVSSFISAGIIGITLLFLTPVFYYLPKALLASIIMVAVFALVDLKYPMKLIRNNKEEFSILILTFFVTIFIGITEGIILGVLASLIHLVYRTSTPHIAILGKIKGTEYYKNIKRFKDDVEIDSRVLIIRFDGQLYFGNKDYFKREVLKLVKLKKENLETIIINSEPINYIDNSSVIMLEEFIDELKEKNIRVLFSKVIGPTRDIIKRSGLENKINKEHLFVNTQEAYNFATKNIQKSNFQNKIALQTKED